MPQLNLIRFVCPEGHVIEVDLSEIKDTKRRCERCDKVYQFRQIDLKPIKESE